MRALPAPDHPVRIWRSFLIGVNKKQPVSISVDKSEEIFMASKEPQSGCFTITKDNWGYTEIRLRTDCEFIKLSKPVLTLDNFIGKNISV